MKKIITLVALIVIVLTCIFAFVSCGDKADPNDPILGWYVGSASSSNNELICFSIRDGKLMYNIADKDNYIEVIKNKDGQYTVNSLTFTLDTTHDEKWISNRNDFTIGNGLYKYVASADKTYAEAHDIFSMANPWFIHDNILGWYRNADNEYLHIYISNGRLVWAHNDENQHKNLSRSASADDVAIYSSGSVTLSLEYTNAEQKTIAYRNSMAFNPVDVIYTFVAKYDKAFDELQ